MDESDGATDRENGGEGNDPPVGQAPPERGGFGILRNTAMAVFDDLQNRNRQTRLTSSWLLAISVLAMGYAWGEVAGGKACSCWEEIAGQPGYYITAGLFASSFGFLLRSVYPGKYWALAYDLSEIYKKRRDTDVFTTEDANVQILDALLFDKGESTNILISVARDTEKRFVAQKWGVYTLAAGFISIIFEHIATL